MLPEHDPFWCFFFCGCKSFLKTRSLLGSMVAYQVPEKSCLLMCPGATWGKITISSISWYFQVPSMQVQETTPRNLAKFIESQGRLLVVLLAWVTNPRFLSSQMVMHCKSFQNLSRDQFTLCVLGDL